MNASRGMMPSYTPLPIPPTVQAHLIINTVVVFITVIVVGLRVVSRIVAGSKLGWDDFLTLLAVPQGICMLVLQGVWSPTGFGYDLSVASDNMPFIYSLLLPFDLIFATCTLTAKLSVLCFYLRVFTSKSMRLATILTMSFVVAWGVGNILQTILVCHLVDGKWQNLRPQYCQGQEASFISMGLFNCITNVIIMLVPLYTIWSLKKTSLATRWGLSGVFMMSLIVTVVSAVRIAALVKEVDIVNLARAMDMVVFLTNLEVQLSILCNSLPMLIPLYAWWKDRRFGGDGEDEYVTRLRGSSTTGPNGFLVEDLTNGLPLETIYGKNNIHFTATVGRGDPRSPAQDRFEDESWDGESTRRLPSNAQAITIETKWSITEETQKKL